MTIKIGYRIKKIWTAAILVAAACTLSCSRSDTAAKRAFSRQLARASQAMSESAHLGSLAVTNAMYAERDPHPQAYVGALLFERYCESCHGKSRKAPNITENRINTSDAESDYYIIRYGINDMPGFRTKLTVFQIYDILAYMKQDLDPLIQKRRSGNN